MSLRGRDAAAPWRIFADPSALREVPLPDRDSMMMSFGDHLEELRGRLILCLLGVGILFVIGLLLGGRLLEFITIPLTEALLDAGQPANLLATSPIETFAAYVKVALVMAALAGVPWVFYQVWLFISPGLYQEERRFVYFLIPLSAVLTAIGFAFLYYILLPISLAFLIRFGTAIVDQNVPVAPVPEGVTLPSVPVLKADPTDPAVGQYWINESLGQMRVRVRPDETYALRLDSGGAISQIYRVGEYVSLVFWLGIVFALAFQLPLVLMLLNWVGILEPRDITPYRRHVAFGAAAAGALLTPQDPMSMILLGGVLYLLFEFGLLLMRFVPARRVAAGGRTDADEGDE